MTRGTAQILKHPGAIIPDLQVERFRWICEAIYYMQRGDRNNQGYCQGRASGLNEAIVAMGGESISLRLEDYLEGAA